MIRRISILMILVLTVGLFATGTASANESQNPHNQPLTELPVCIGEASGEMGSESIGAENMVSGVMPDGMTMSREMMLTDLTNWFAVLPPGIATQILAIAHHMSDDTLMMLHYEFHHTNLLHQPPGQILNHVKDMSSHASHTAL